MKLSVVIPALNEEGIVGKTVKSVPLKELKEIGLETEILVVDNASTDNTAKEASEAGAKVVLETNRGYGNAYLRGFKEAQGDIIVMGDADGTYPFDEMAEFIQPILKGEAEFVMGSRLKGDIQPGAMPALHKYIGNPFLTWVLNALFHTGISDAHCGMRAMTKEALNKMHLKTAGMEFASEMVIEASRKKLKIAEVPITYYPREGESKLSSFSDGWRHLRFMMMYRPGPFLFIPGVVAFVLGIALNVVVWSQGISRMHSIILGGMLLIIGYQLLLSWLYFGAFGAAYGFSRSSNLSKKLMNYHSLEKELLVGVVFLAIGVIIGLYVIYNWINGGFGPLSQLQNTMMAMIFCILGIQTIFSSMFLSLLLLNKDNNEN
ncbi:family 2 glycosyl transferase [Methanobacterium sp. MB1]|jgi:glycosyltransferase involved in cell wall biosynthesis|uniref:glycosyltransferase family 2 protein n=1 Tax=Methanobacterium sp. TaxID=2164 RepID=UPI0003C925C6|nr:glycosyltransferase family 2 protein [uncultured Methanobacterium sp.]CDG65191.1 family 2 glycosyl transferase [Methanobacterium sp. MB1]